LITRARHREALTAALTALQRVKGTDADLAAEDIRSALRELARITGRFDVEAVLDRVFSAFCIGK
jgi:tRNA modification GTPase